MISDGLTMPKKKKKKPVPEMWVRGASTKGVHLGKVERKYGFFRGKESSGSSEAVMRQ